MHTYRLNKVKITYRNVIQSLTRHCVLMMMHSTIPFLYLFAKGPCLPHSYRTITIQTGQRMVNGQPVALIQALRHTQPVSFRKDSFTHTGPLPLYNKSAYENLATLIGISLLQKKST